MYDAIETVAEGGATGERGPSTDFSASSSSARRSQNHFSLHQIFFIAMSLVSVMPGEAIIERSTGALVPGACFQHPS
jgi:hypothetical protein